MTSSGDEADCYKRTPSPHGRRFDKFLRVWCPGAYDLFHMGHAEFLSKAKWSGGNAQVIIGLYSDDEILHLEGPPVFNQDERYEMLSANKWVDEIIKVPNSELSLEILDKFDCNYAVVGGKFQDQTKKCDPEIQHGYLKHIPYRRGISTSSIIHRILAIEERDINNNSESGKNWDNYFSGGRPLSSNGITCAEIMKFGFKMQPQPKPTDKIVYISGAFDLLHPGHLGFIKAARDQGDYLIVGIHSDENINKYSGKKFPIMKWNERVSALLSCKYVSEVIMDAPYIITDSLLDEFKISLVLSVDYETDFKKIHEVEKLDPYTVPKIRGIYAQINSAGMTKLSTEAVVQRVQSRWFDYEERLSVTSSTDFAALGLHRETASDDSLAKKAPATSV